MSGAEVVETPLQVVIRGCVGVLIRVPGIFDHGSNTQYGLMNYIARYSLAADHYLMSRDGALLIAQRSTPYRRTWLDKVNGTYEHLVPAAVVRSLLRDSDRSDTAVASILQATSGVAIVSKAEDRLLRVSGLGSKMPFGWTLAGGSRTARYEAVGIQIVGSVAVAGVLIR